MAALLDIEQLQTFVAIAESGSFTRAAEQVFRTQSAVSMQMKRLEERLGRDLFVREGRHCRLTDEGQRLLDYARRILHLNAEAIAVLAESGLDGHVRLGTPDDLADRFLPEILARFSHAFPRAEVTVLCEPTPTLVERVKSHDLDLAIITHTDGKGHQPAQVIRREPLHWVASPRFVVPKTGDLPLALGRQTCCWRLAAETELKARGRPYRVLYSSWSSMAVSAAVAAGLAVSVLPECAIRPEMRVLGAGDGFPSLPSCKIGLLRDNARESPLVTALAEHITSSLDNSAHLAIPAE